MVKKKFIRGLNPKIAPLVYATNPRTLTTAIDTATWIVIGFKIIARTFKIGNVESDEIAELRKQIANLALVKQMRSKWAVSANLKNWNGRTNWLSPVSVLNQSYEQVSNLKRNTKTWFFISITM